MGTSRVSAMVRAFSLLGQGEAVNTAAEQMVDSIRDGTPLRDAVQVFCTELTQ